MYMQSFTPSPLGAQYQSPMALYAHGGHTNNHQMHQDAQELRHYGMGRDKVLAHINPAEASYLEHHHGMSINPHTGLPQFGLWDMLKSGAGAVGSAAMNAAPGLWSEYGAPMAQRGLEAIDRRVQGALPGLAQSAGQKIGGTFFGPQGAQLGQSFGQNLANQFSNAGGFAGQVMPRINQRMGMQGPSQYPQMGRGDIGGMFKNAARGAYNDVGKGMAQSGLQNVDETMMGLMPKVGQSIGNALGSRMGMGGMGSALGQRAGNALSDRYSNTSGIRGQVMPRMNQMMNPQPEVPQAFSHGGYAYNHPYSGAGMHDMDEGGYQHQYPFSY